VNFWGIINLKLLLDVLFALGFGLLLFSRVKEQRTLWLLRGYLFLVSSAWFIQRYAYLPLTSKLLKHAKIKKSMLFVGQGKTFQIWEPTSFEKFRVTARKKSNINRANLKWEQKLNN